MKSFIPVCPQNKFAKLIAQASYKLRELFRVFSLYYYACYIKTITLAIRKLLLLFRENYYVCP